jgi:hypothetical protein
MRDAEYSGEWKDGKMNGNGKYEWDDGRYYSGEYLNDKKHGFGEYKWISGKVYIGLWSNGV